MSSRATSYLVAVCLVASLGGFLFGFDTAVVSGALAGVKAQFGLDAIREGWFGSSALVGCILGAACAFVLCDRFGRRPSLLLAGAFFLASALCAALAPDFTWLVWGRVLGGLGVGIASVAAPMYISEFAPPAIRGRLVAFYQLSIVVGILVAYLSNWLLDAYAHGGGAALAQEGLAHRVFAAEVWRAMFLMGALPAAAFLALLAFVPESPRWLAEAGRREEALDLLERLLGCGEAREEMEAITRPRPEGSSLAELLRPGLRTALLVGVGLSVFGQFSGVNIVVYYGPRILAGAAISASMALRFQVLLGLVNLLFTLVAIWKVDSWGRRPLLVGGMAVVAASMAATSALYHWHAPALAIVGLLSLYIACLAVSICGVIWVLTSEIFPNHVRGRAVSICVFANWGSNWLSAFLFPWYVTRFGLAAGFLAFAVICALATLFFHALVPETKGRTLEAIAAHWTARGNA
jgi:MFS transporter, SP family, arabinose:H+ symporter